MKKYFLFTIAIILITLAAAAYWFGEKDPAPTVPPPETEQTKDWLIYSDDARQIIFRYPESLPTKYIQVTDWPPQVEIIEKPFACTEAGEISARSGQTERRQIDGREYCRTSVVEGTAGSLYTQYAYAFPSNKSTIILTFSTRAVQCSNYDAVEREACEKERNTFNIDVIADQIVDTVTVTAENSALGRSGIQGVVFLGPTCPVVSDPPDPACDDKPFQTSLVVTTSDQSRVIKEFSSTANGTFSVELPPGEYAIRSAAAANILPYCAHDMFIVAKSTFTDLTIACDSGIR